MWSLCCYCHKCYIDKVDDGEEDEQVNVTINIRELDDVLMKDVGNIILESGK